MNLRYQIPDQLYYIQNFLDQSTYERIHNNVIKERKKINVHSVKGVWENSLINNIVSPEKAEVSDYPPFEKLKMLTKHNQFYQWHCDYTWKYGATYYLNNRWGQDWGGEFMFSDKNGHGFIPVVGNSLVIIKAPFQHKVNPVLNSLMPRISVQMFMK
mgnify:CR=1 FL=1